MCLLAIMFALKIHFLPFPVLFSAPDCINEPLYSQRVFWFSQWKVPTGDQKMVRDLGDGLHSPGSFLVTFPHIAGPSTKNSYNHVFWVSFSNGCITWLF